MCSSMHTTGIVIGLLAAAAGLAQGQVNSQFALGAGNLGVELPGDAYAQLHSVGDFNHDGHRDLLLHNYADEIAWVLLGDAQGNYTTYGPYEAIFDNSIVAGQFDDDAEPEIAFRDFGFGYSIVFEPGAQPVEDADFSISYFGGIGEDAFAGVIKAADFDGDGQDELVFNTSDDMVYIRWSGTNTLSPIALNGLGEENVLYDPADYDGDGDLDILLYSKDSQHFWLIEGTGASSMGPAREIMRAYPSIVNDERPVFGQLDSNPAMDMIVADLSLQEMRNEFNFVLNSASSEEIDTDEVALPLLITGDIDGDGGPDLVVMRTDQFPLVSGFSPDYEPGVLYNPTGDSPFIEDMSVGQPRRSSPYDQSSIFDAPLQLVWSFDADNDGDEDLIWRYENSIIENRTGVPGVPALGMPAYDMVDGALYILPIDLDSDGYDEYIISGSSNMRIFDMQDGTTELIAGSNNGFMVVQADLDGDGTPELVSSDTSVNRLRTWSIMPDGSVGNRIAFPTDDRGPYYGLEVADFNGDGLDDIAATTVAGSVHIYAGGVGPDLTLWAEVDSTDPNGIKSGVLDYNKDGLPDLAIASDANNSIELYANAGDGSFSAGPVLQRAVSDSWQYWIETGDIDLDGNTDIAYVENYASGYVVVMFLNADGTLDETVEIYTNEAVELVIEDFNSDGLPDLGIAGSMFGSSASSPSVILQTAPRQFGHRISLPGFASTSVAVSDVNLDDTPDLVSVSVSDLQFRTYYGTPNPCPADLTGDGELNFFDVSQLLTEQVDYNSDGLFNFFDVSAFLIDFKAGCP